MPVGENKIIRIIKRRRPRVVVIGGGTGLPVILNALKKQNAEITAIVTVSDDGGSSGVIRNYINVVPPGDMRNVLVSLSDLPEEEKAIFQYRFESNDAFFSGHSIGNLIIAALSEMRGNIFDAIQSLSGMMKVDGHVYPASNEPLTLNAEFMDATTQAGETEITGMHKQIKRVWVTNTNSSDEPSAMQPVIDAVMGADAIVLGPGSLFTSIIPNLLVPGVVESIRKAHSREENPVTTLFVCNLADMQGETWGMNCYDYVEALMRHGMEGLLDYVLIHQDAGGDPGVTGFFPVIRDYSDSRFQTRGRRSGKVRRVDVSDALVERIAALGPVPIVRDLVDRERPTWHDHRALARAFGEVLAQCRLPQR